MSLNTLKTSQILVKKTPKISDLNGHPLSCGSKGEENKTGHQSNPDRELG